MHCGVYSIPWSFFILPSFSPPEFFCGTVHALSIFPGSPPSSSMFCIVTIACTSLLQLPLIFWCFALAFWVPLDPGNSSFANGCLGIHYFAPLVWKAPSSPPSFWLPSLWQPHVFCQAHVLTFLFIGSVFDAVLVSGGFFVSFLPWSQTACKSSHILQHSQRSLAGKQKLELQKPLQPQ